MSQTKLKILKLCQVNLLQILLLSTWFILGASVSPEVKKASIDGHNEHRKNAGLDLFEWRAGLGKFEPFLKLKPGETPYSRALRTYLLCFLPPTCLRFFTTTVFFGWRGEEEKEPLLNPKIDAYVRPGNKKREKGEIVMPQET